MSRGILQEINRDQAESEGEIGVADETGFKIFIVWCWIQVNPIL